MAYNALRQPFGGFNPAMNSAQDQFYGLTSPSNYAQSPGFSETDIVEQASPPYSSPSLAGGSRGRTGGLQLPPTDALLDPYRSPSLEPPTPGNIIGVPPRLRSSGRLDLNDPVAMHLLVETAMGDSQDYEVLSFEELEALKREQVQLNQKIEAVRRKLTLEAKVKDAAASLQRLFGKGRGDASPPQRGRAPAGRTGADTKKDSMLDSSDELAASTKKVDELSRELYRLEARARQVSTQLLRHTAGVLQMTHKGPSKDNTIRTLLPDGMGPAIRPDSPASIFTYENGRVRSFGAMDDGFDDRSFYRGIDDLDGQYDGYVPKGDAFAPKVDAFAPKGLGLSALKDMGGPTKPSLPEGTLSSIEERVEDLNERLRGFLVEINSARSDYAQGPPAKKGEPDPQAVQTLNSQIDYLGRVLDDLKNGYASQKQRTTQSLNNTETRLQTLNQQISKIMNAGLVVEGKTYPAPPSTASGDLQDQLRYAAGGLSQIEKRSQALVEEMEEAKNKPADKGEDREQYGVVLEGLWQIILAGEEERRSYKRKRREMLSTNPDTDDAASDISDFSPDEDSDPNEPFSLPAFSAKVQWLYGRSSTLREQSSILRRQIRQQRQLNSKSDAQRETMVNGLTAQLDAAREEKAAAERELKLMEAKLVQLNKDMEELSKKKLLQENAELDSLRKRERELLEDLRKRERELVADVAKRDSLIEKLEKNMTSAVKEEQSRLKGSEADLLKQLREKNNRVTELESELDDIRDDNMLASAEQAAKLKETTERVNVITAELEAVKKERMELETKTNKESEEMKAEIRNLESEIVRLGTEVTIARAELDGAYGSRAQRAAEIAGKSNKASEQQIQDLTTKNGTLEKQIEDLRAEIARGPPQSEREKTLKEELAATLADFEDLTRANVESEKERENLETLIDQLRDRIETLETQINEEKVRWLGMKSPGTASATPGASAESTSTVVLKNEFKKLMRDTRTENMKVLRAEQEERRRLEGVIRQLKKDQGRGLSALGRTPLTPA